MDPVFFILLSSLKYPFDRTNKEALNLISLSFKAITFSILTESELKLKLLIVTLLLTAKFLAFNFSTSI